MAQDDYHVIVFKILAYLYKLLKHKTNILPENYLIPLTSDFPIESDYFLYVLEHLYDDDFIENVRFIKAWGAGIVDYDIRYIRITPKGITYLRENSIMKKLARTLNEAKQIITLFD